jgi:RNA polymerase sigma factor (sigma-70 family)
MMDMATSRLSKAVQDLCRATLKGGAGLSDQQLLDHFIEHRDEAAFAALVRRHGPVVWGVCRRLLGHHHDAEDAFQATFLVLARKAASVRPREMVANWLYGVAHRTALKAKAMAARRRGREKQVLTMPDPKLAQQDRWSDLEPLLDQALAGLPDKYRIAIILCDLESKTGKQAARLLKIPEGTLATRLRTARAILARRLARHGFMVPGSALAVTLSQNAATASAPIAVVCSTIKAAPLCAAGQAAAMAAMSPKVAALMEGVLKMMLVSKFKIMMGATFVAATCFTVAVGLSLVRPSEAQGDMKRDGRGSLARISHTAPAPGNDLVPSVSPERRSRSNPPPEVSHLAMTIKGWSVAQTPNFRVFHKSTQLQAEEIARQAEWARTAACRKWFGAVDTAWKFRCDIYAHRTPTEAAQDTGLRGDGSGYSTFHFAEDRLLSMRVDLCQDKKRTLATGVLHEVTHVVLGAHFLRPLPRWADEGMAMLAEPCRNVQVHLGELRKYRRDNALFPLQTLLELKDYPPKNLQSFYAQSVSLVQFLLHEGGRRTFIAFLADGLEKGYEIALWRHYGWGVKELEERWSQHAFSDIDE